MMKGWIYSGVALAALAAAPVRAEPQGAAVRRPAVQTQLDRAMALIKAQQAQID